MRFFIFCLLGATFFINLGVSADFNRETNLSQAQQTQYQKQSLGLFKSIEKYISKLDEEKQVGVKDTIVKRVEGILEKNIPERHNYIFSYLIFKLNEEKTPTSKLYEVTRVIDGDTIEVSDNGTLIQVRIIGIDTPESVNTHTGIECFGLESSQQAKNMLLGKSVRLEKDESQEDKDIFGRYLRYVYGEDGLSYNLYMIKNGYAFEYTYKTSYMFQSQFQKAQEEAKGKLLGLWSSETCNGNIEKIGEEKEEILEEKEEILEEKDTEYKGTTFYTSRHYTSELYYCEDDSDWEGLSKTYLENFQTEEELLKKYPYKTLNKPCN